MITKDQNRNHYIRTKIIPKIFKVKYNQHQIILKYKILQKIIFQKIKVITNQV